MKSLSVICACAVVSVVGLYLLPGSIGVGYQSFVASSTSASLEVFAPRSINIPTPDVVKGIYMTGWVAGRKDLRSELVRLVDETELNSIVIDIKDYSGKLSFKFTDPEVYQYDASERRIADIDEFIQELHNKNIYVIGRISVFQDSHMAKIRPEWAVISKISGKPWKDRNNISWIDPHSRQYWKYIVDIGREAHRRGFDELNFDYIRFPTDGVMTDIVYPFGDGRTKSEVIHDFFRYIRAEFPSTTPISADLFGMTTTNRDDLGIGQILEHALENFDYVAPMVYPSHYPATWNGIDVPNKNPYQVIKLAMGGGVERALAASTSPDKLRPWLQDFSIFGVNYTAEMVRDQIRASKEVGLNSWMMWNASNVYTKEAYLKEGETHPYSTTSNIGY